MMQSPKITYKYYSNPAFCAQSEVVYTQQTPCVSARISTSPPRRTALQETTRVPPLGANSPRKISSQVEYEKSRNQRVKTDISDNPLRNQNAQGFNKSISKSASPSIDILDLPPKPGPKPLRFAIITPESRNNGKTFSRSASQRVLSSKNEFVHRRVNSTRGHKIGEELEMLQVANTSCPAQLVNTLGEDTESAIRQISSRVLKHRYAEIPDDFEDYSPSKKRIIETEPVEYNVDGSSEDEIKDVPTEIVRTVNGRIHRYAIIPSEDDEEIMEEDVVETTVIQRSASPPTFHLTSPGMSRKKLEATQKLHELLATPKKCTKRFSTASPLKSFASTPSIRAQLQSPNRALSPERAGFPITPTKSIVSSTPKQTIMSPSKSCNNLTSPPLPRRNHTSPLSPKAQQKLNYDMNTTIDMNSSVGKPCPDFYVKESSFVKSREHSFVKSREHSFVKSREHSFVKNREDHNKSYEIDNRDSAKINKYMDIRKSTAVISPRLITRGNESIYSSGTVFSGKSWNINPGCATLALAATMMALCGALTAALSFYIMCTFGRQYYLDIGALSGFICMILGMLGFRSRTSQLLPNRNYVSGYIILSIFSLSSCAALLTLLISSQGNQGGALANMTGGAVSALGALCLLLACGGALASCCCTKTPPDNRVMGA